MESDEIYEFGPFRLEVRERRLLRSGQPLPVRAKVFDTLRVLVQNHGRLVRKDELMKAVWPDAMVEEGNLAHNLTVLRKTLAGKEATPEYVETVPGQGYRFVAEVMAVQQADEPPPASSVTPERPAASWEQRLEAARLALRSKGIFSQARPGLAEHVVGRAKELSELFSAFQTAYSGQARLVCIAGEPGIGKSTLVQRFLADIHLSGVNCVVAVGRCLERLAGTEAYLPVLEALESLLSGQSGRDVAELMKLVAPTWYVQVAPLWASADPSFSAVLSDAKAASRERMMREFALLIQEISGIQPVVIFLDDLHWADASTTELLPYLSQKLASDRVLILVAYRQSEMLLGQHPFIAIRQELQKQRLCREITVELLSRDDIQAYLSLELPDYVMPGNLTELVYRRTEGNPLFMVDLVRHLREQGSLASPLELTKCQIPESVRGMIQRRLDQLDENELQVLAAAAVQGQEFDSQILADVLHLEPAVVEERLQRLDRVHFFVRLLRENELPDQSFSLAYTFSHVLYQQGINETMAPSQKVALSRETAEAILARYRDSSALVASRLALLFEAARDSERASDFFLMAAAHAARLYANNEAVALTRRAIAAADRLTGEGRHSRVLAANLQMGQIHVLISRFQEAMADFEAAEGVAEETGDVESRVRAICGRAMTLFSLRRLEEVRREGERASALAASSASLLAQASADAVLAVEHMNSGDVAAAELRFNRAIPVLRQDKKLFVQSLDVVSARGLLHHMRLEYDQIEETSIWAIEQARKLGASFYVLENLFFWGMALANNGRLTQAADALREGMRLAEQNGERFLAPCMVNVLAWVYREMGDVETSIRLGLEGVRQGQEMESPEAEVYSRLHLAGQYIDLGEPQRAEEQLNEVQHELIQDLHFKWRIAIRLDEEWAGHWILRGDSKKAHAHAVSALNHANRTLSRKHIAWARKLVGDVAVSEERFDDAERGYESALRALKSHPCLLIEWKILAAWASLAKTLRQGDREDDLVARCKQVKDHLAESIADKKLRNQFLSG
jgi:DNA-binding winged helix-turn-helix (wHTH) protein/tetratricopeptide (TPR) repeat protein